MPSVQQPAPLDATPGRADPEHAARRRLARTTGVAARGYAWIVVSLRLGVIGCWAVLAALAALHLPAFGSSGGPIVTLIPRVGIVRPF